MNTEEKIKIAVRALDGKKAAEIFAVGIGDLTVLADYFVMATATSSTHVRALADEVEFKLGEAGVPPLRTEGKATDWILLDYGDIIVHVFGKAARDFYALDRIWADGEPVDVAKYIEEGKDK